MVKQGQYYYTIHGRYFAIYRCVFNDGHTSMGEKVVNEPPYYDREQARRRVYELNGWNYTPKQPKA